MTETTETIRPEFKVTRRWNAAHTIAKLHITENGQPWPPIGGMRAARAEAVILIRWNEEDDYGYYGVRGDHLKAVVEAEKLSTSRPWQVRFGGRLRTLRDENGSEMMTIAAEWAKAVRVEEEPGS